MRIWSENSLHESTARAIVNGLWCPSQRELQPLTTPGSVLCTDSQSYKHDFYLSVGMGVPNYKEHFCSIVVAWKFLLFNTWRLLQVLGGILGSTRSFPWTLTRKGNQPSADLIASKSSTLSPMGVMCVDWWRLAMHHEGRNISRWIGFWDPLWSWLFQGWHVILLDLSFHNSRFSIRVHIMSMEWKSVVPLST